MLHVELVAEWKNLQLRFEKLMEWSLGFNRRKRALGVCRYLHKRIELSEFHATNDPAKHVLDTLRHEAAHALAGHTAGHGPKWKAWAIRVGATPERCATAEDSKEMVRQPG